MRRLTYSMVCVRTVGAGRYTVGGLSLYDCFYETAQKCGDDIAIQMPDTMVTYGELLAALEAVAARIVQMTPRRPRRVGLLASRSMAAYAGYLAVLRLGAAVVPMNPYSTDARNLAVADEAGLDAVILDEAGAHMAEELSGRLCVPVLDLSGSWTRSSGGLDVPPPDGAGDIAYIAFTSGSTGRPKGIPISHANAVTFVDDAVDRFGFGRGSRVAQVFELSFDPAIVELFGAWTVGGTLCVVPHGDALFPDTFVNDLDLTHLIILPSMVTFALGDGQFAPGSLPTLQHALIGGEPVTVRHAAALAAAAPNGVIHNCYGPTELTIMSAEYTLPSDSSSWPPTANGTIPIGLMYPHLEHCLLDENLRIAEEGELCVRGPQRFAGYLDTADNVGRFVRIDGQRTIVYDGTGALTADYWYRTGDRVACENGLLVHYGRLDSQLKINGFRVELGEIEAVLRAHPDVVDVVVVGVEHSHTELVLHGFYTGRRVPAEELAKLAAQLPAHMRPADYHHRKQIPLTSNNKADRRRLADELIAVKHPG